MIRNNHILPRLIGKVSNRAHNAISRDLASESGVLPKATSCEDLARIPDAHFLQVRNFGLTCLRELRRAVPFVSGPLRHADDNDWEAAYRLASFGEADLQSETSTLILSRG